MVLPTRLRYGLVRLRALNRPKFWGVGAGAVLLGMAAYQYGNHPEWLRSFELSGDRPVQTGLGTDLDQLSVEELAGLAEIDNLALLLNQMQPTTSALTPADPTSSSPDLTLPGLQLPQITPPSPDPAANPFQSYLDRLQFQGGADRPSGSTAMGSTGWAAPAPGSTGLGRSLASTDPASPGTRLGSAPLATASPEATLSLSPLQQALAQTSAERASREMDRPEAESTPDRREPALAPSGITPPSWMVEGQLPGVDQRFMRTVPEMSPPPGTTGYRPPATLPPATLPPATTPGAASGPGSLPTPAPLDLNFRPAPSQPTSGAVPAPGVASPAFAPGAGLGDRPSQPQPGSTLFSVPRPPGSHTGGGYIHTFSDPNGPVD